MLDKTLTPELLEEGKIRELIRHCRPHVRRQD